MNTSTDLEFVMNVVSKTLLWCFVIGYLTLLLWFGFFLLGGDFAYNIHSKRIGHRQVHQPIPSSLKEINMKLLTLLAALLLVGCSVEVAHENENEAQTESLSTFDKSKTAVSVGILEVPEKSPETTHKDSPVPTTQTTVKVIVSEPSPKVIMTPPPVPRCPEPTIQVAGDGNSVVLGDVHLHLHEHFHFHETPKPTPVRINVRVEDRISERERRTRMVERRIAKFFPHYRD